MSIVRETNIKELKFLFKGKVRDIYEVSKEEWLVVTTDRISAFDVVFNEPIPGKGIILNKISNLWFEKIKFLPNHIMSTNPIEKLPFLRNYEGVNERSVLVKKVNRLPVECVVRGYLFGSVYNEYKKFSTAGGIKLKQDLKLADKLPEPIFTPATKAETGHDENINYEKFVKVVGKNIADEIIKYSIQIYKFASEKMEKNGIILADTKFEFGIDEKGNLILVDEVLTPDSSRYWDAETYKAGENPISFDKQFLRDYLDSIKWDKTPPPPILPEDIIKKTKQKYEEILKIIEKALRD
ncbi:MAG: phosphoribosylaminoimidazolesuccinocarboxamide synthase [Brevinematales bacterium]|nr:phosphoribosylaminoimidazolesuccinocarboxamide synthase [Brevinematales bacterium]